MYTLILLLMEKVQLLAPNLIENTLKFIIGSSHAQNMESKNKADLSKTAQEHLLNGFRIPLTL